ncbi:unnamed protein product [Clonostachys rhizophaga]|uniref:Uncharacterized protein n=1 Tax=Clonostachys rhizophaga TaxID=160324 RepID=A0A9N9YM17_9HYPO|nr:unnamed protein product [Clonostachys rhizophaga]
MSPGKGSFGEYLFEPPIATIYDRLKRQLCMSPLFSWSPFQILSINPPDLLKLGCGLDWSGLLGHWSAGDRLATTSAWLRRRHHDGILPLGRLWSWLSSGRTSSELRHRLDWSRLLRHWSTGDGTTTAWLGGRHHNSVLPLRGLWPRLGSRRPPSELGYRLDRPGFLRYRSTGDRLALAAASTWLLRWYHDGVLALGLRDGRVPSHQLFKLILEITIVEVDLFEEVPYSQLKCKVAVVRSERKIVGSYWSSKSRLSKRDQEDRKD